MNLKLDGVVIAHFLSEVFIKSLATVPMRKITQKSAGLAMLTLTEIIKEKQ